MRPAACSGAGLSHRMLRIFLGAALLWTGTRLPAQAPDTWPDPGLPATRDMFPLNLIPLNYRPVSAVPVGAHGFRASILVARSNTFEFSDLVKESLQELGNGRFEVDPGKTAAFAAAHASEPLIYYFDGEIQRTELRLAWGATRDLEIGVALAWQGLSGGFLDGTIETFHDLGFQQAGRTSVRKDQMSLVVIQKGQVVLCVQEPARVHPDDPVLSFLQRLHEDPRLTVSLAFSLQVPLTRWNGVYRSDWDSSLGVAAQWRPASRFVVEGGMAVLRRSLKQDGPAPFFIKDQTAAHLGLEWRGWSRVRPYLLLVGTNHLARSSPASNLDKPSLIHDLGAHVRLGPRVALTLGYINNISHNENTADMGVTVRLSVRTMPRGQGLSGILVGEAGK